MKKAHIAFVAMLCCMSTNVVMGAVAIKKAAPVATQSASNSATTASLVPNVLSLVSNVQQLNAKQKEMDKECIPSSAEINFVDNIIKEWAKTGSMTAEEVQQRLKRRPCARVNGYEESVQFSAATETDNVCYNTFAEEGMIWDGYPKVGLASYCADGTRDCKNKKTASDIYQIFDLVDFGYADYTGAEATMAAKLIAKMDECSDSELSDKKRAMWGEFLTTSIGNVGQKTSTGAIMDAVGNLGKSGTNVTGGLSSLGSIATSIMNK